MARKHLNQRAELRNEPSCTNMGEAELLDRAKRREIAAAEPTMSGQLRRAIRGSELPLSEVADRIGVTAVELSEFMSGDRTLPSDILDSLAKLLGCELVQTR